MSLYCVRPHLLPQNTPPLPSPHLYHPYVPPAITAVQQARCVGHGGVERFYPAPQRFPGPFGPHVSDRAVNSSARLHVMEAWQTDCCHWSRSVAASVNDLEGDLCACARVCGCMRSLPTSIFMIYFYRQYFLPILSVTIQHLFHSFSHTLSQHMHIDIPLQYSLLERHIGLTAIKLYCKYVQFTSTCTYTQDQQRWA